MMQSPIKQAIVFLCLGLAACGDNTNDQNKKDESAAPPAMTEEQKVTEPMTDNSAFVADNLAYLEANKAKDGVTVTASGLQYMSLVAGEGASPAIDDIVTVHYTGKLIDGSVFDSSIGGEPVQFPVGRVIPGWVEALQLMQVGDKWELTIPSDLAYGPDGAEDVIPGGATLIFEVELLKVQTLADARAEQMAEIEAMRGAQVAYLDQNAKQDGVTVTESGLQYRVIEEGTGKSPTAASTVTVHYAGTLIDGTEFDSSYRRGEPISFGLNRVIKGWTEGVQLMKEGAKYEFTIPYDLAYGERGSRSIPPFATLIFTVELISVDS